MTRLRRADPDDAPELVRLRAVMLQAMGVPGVDLPGWRSSCERELRERLQDGGDLLAYVVERDVGGLAACAVGILQRWLPGPSSSGVRGHLVNVVTDEDQRRRGHAGALTEALLADFVARGVRRVDLHATKDAAGIYRDLGFAPHRHEALTWRAAP